MGRPELAGRVSTLQLAGQASRAASVPGRCVVEHRLGLLELCAWWVGLSVPAQFTAACVRKLLPRSEAVDADRRAWGEPPCPARCAALLVGRDRGNRTHLDRYVETTSALADLIPVSGRARSGASPWQLFARITLPKIG